jgi:hypothetical protein
MQSECKAITPQFICSYAWKQPPARPAIFQRAQKLLSRASENSSTGAAEVERHSVSWKAYLEARERQHLASDIVEGFFNAPRGVKPYSPVRPEILTSKVTGKGLLAPILPQEAAVLEPVAAGSTCGLPIAA